MKHDYVCGCRSSQEITDGRVLWVEFPVSAIRNISWSRSAAAELKFFPVDAQLFLFFNPPPARDVRRDEVPKK